MPKRILVATDFSTRAEKALLRAKLIAARTGAALTLAHRPERLWAPAMIEARALLREIAVSFAEDGVRAEPLVETGEAAEGILSAADEADADLIIVGPHRDRVLGTFSGRTVERLVRSCRRPLLIAVMPPLAPYRRALLALDFDEASAAATRAALDLGVFDRLQVTVMHSAETTEGAFSSGAQEAIAARLQALLAELGSSGPGVRTIVTAGSPAQTILESASADDADLVILGTSQRKGPARLLIGSVAAEVLRDNTRDMLIVPVEHG